VMKGVFVISARFHSYYHHYSYDSSP